MHEINEECGVFGIWSPEKKPLPYTVAIGLTALQHRGQEAAGMAVNEDRNIRYHKAPGLVMFFRSVWRLRLSEEKILPVLARLSTTL